MNEEILHKGLYAVIPASVRYDPNLKDKAKLLYGEISALSNEKGYCWASNKYFAELYNCTTATISAMIKNLIDNGYLKSILTYKENSKEIKNRYLIIVDGGIKENLNTYSKNFDDPTQKNLKENNTSINNINIYNILSHFSQTSVFPKVNKLTDSRRKKLLLRIEEQGEDNIIKAIDIASESDFLKGKNDRGWKMDFDWLIANDTNIVKILEGKYSNNNQKEGRMYGPILN